MKQRLLTGTFGIKFEPFLKNAEPLESATTLIIETKDEEIQIPINEAYDLIIAFSKEGKALKEDGPVHILFEDGSNKDQPIKYVKGFRVE